MSANPLAPEWLVHPDDANALAPEVWPSGAARAASGAIAIDGVEATALAAEFGTPLYVVDENDARARAARLKAAFDDAFAAVGGTVKVYYAGKAFLCTEIARWMTAAGLEHRRLQRRRAGRRARGRGRPGPPGLPRQQQEPRRDRPQLSGSAWARSSSTASSSSIASPRRRAPRARCRPCGCASTRGVHASTHEYLATAREDQKFGIPLAEAPDVVAQIRAHDSLRFLGLHSHIGSQIFESDGFAEAARRLLAVHAALLAGGDVPELNLGGGFGIAYTSADVVTPIEQIAADFARVVSSECAALGIPVPGRRDRAGPRDHRPEHGDALRGRHDQAGVEVATDARPPRPACTCQRRRRHERQHPARALRRRLLGADREPGLGCRPGPGAHRRQALRERRHRRARRLPAGRRHPRRPASPCPRPAPTAGRSRATTTTSAGPPSSPCATARRA